MRFLLAQIVMRRMAIKSKLNLLSYFLRETGLVGAGICDEGSVFYLTRF